jgi:hypothetical protein
MTYITGTLTDSNAPATLYGSIATALTTAGYTLEDTVVITTTTWKVWKSPAASNSANLDWYLFVGYTTTGAGTVRFYCSEGYTAATDLVIRGVKGLNSVSTSNGSNAYYARYDNAGLSWDVATGSPYGSTGMAINAVNLGWDTTTFCDRQILAPATSFGYWISITTNRVIALGSGAPTEAVYTGLYAPSQEYIDVAAANTAITPATPIIFPLVSAILTFTSQGGQHQQGTRSFAMISRLGGIPSAPTMPAGTSTSNFAYWTDTVQVVQTGYPFARLPDGLGNGLTTIPGWSTRAAVRKTQLWFIPASTAGSLPLGTLYGAYHVGATVTVTRGDTTTIGGVAAVLSSPAGGYSILFEAV